MLNPKKNRLNYGEILSPPTEGYVLTKAIGTTYSLDLNALMIMPVALLYSDGFDRDSQEIRIDTVDALINSSDKISIYHQQGKIKVPKKYHYLMAFWEKGIHGIRMKNDNQSFHPKIWVIRFDCPGKPVKYRIVVTSRNLTFATDYDVAFETEGTKEKNINPINKPIIDFLHYLNSQRKTMDVSFIKDLERVVFACPEGFENLEFYPIGIDNHYSNPIMKHQWEDLMVISPFLDTSTVQALQHRTKNSIKLLSTQDELSCLGPIIQQENAFQFSKYIEQSVYHDDLVTENEYPEPHSIHAKFYIGCNNGRNKLYLGSANCTSPAQERNVEFMIGLDSSNSQHNSKSLMATLTDEKNGTAIFEEFTPCQTDTIEQEKQNELIARKILFQLMGAEVNASVILNPGNSLYDYLLQLNLEMIDVPEMFSVRIKPVSKVEEIDIVLEFGKYNTISGFTSYTENKLTPFFSIGIFFGKERISYSTWQLPIEFPETRLGRIFTSIINSRDKFMEYLLFILNGQMGTTIFEGGEDASKNVNSSLISDLLFDGKPIFENLLIAASRNPVKLMNIQHIMEKIQLEQQANPSEYEQIITEDFLEFWDVFKTFIPQQKKNGR